MEYAANTPEEYAENTLPGGCTDTRHPIAFHISAKRDQLSSNPRTGGARKEWRQGR
jgi:hypothetical protein